MSYQRLGCGCPLCATGGSGSHEPTAAGTWEAANVSTTSVVAYPYTGDYRIDCLMADPSARWNAPYAYGTPVTVTYSFMSQAPGYADIADQMSFMQFNSSQKAAVRQIMSKLQAELNISFQEVSDNTWNYGQIRFGNNYQEYSSGWAYYAGTTYEESGDVWIDWDTPTNLSPTAGNYGYSVLVHEIGHALGLKHPGNYNAGTVAQDEPGNYLGTAEDNTNYTVMSYYDPAGGQNRDWFAMYDLLALKKLYGADSGYNAGNTLHKFTDATGARLAIIDDASGNDTLDLSGLTLGATVDLRSGGFSSVGRNGYSAAVNNLSIDLTTVIENFTGSAYADRVTGNDAANRFTLGQGSNYADGGSGLDFAVYGGTRSSYKASASSGTVSVTGSGVSDTLVNVERLEFSSGKLAFDLGGNAGFAAKVLGAVFGSWSLNFATTVKEGLGALDAGMSQFAAMDLALDRKLGDHASNHEVVDLLYTNIAGHAPSAQAEAYWNGLLESGTYNQVTLGIMAAEQQQNLVNIDFVGLQGSGLAYA